MMRDFKDIDEYIRSFPPSIKAILERMRQTIKAAAPEAVETIAYKMPAFKLNGKTLVYFAAFKNHIGFYPHPSGIANFEKELSGFPRSKGAVQFPLDQPIPYELVKKIVRFRVRETLEPKK